MSEATSQSDKFNATLVPDNGRPLKGVLSSLLDGRLRLESVEAIEQQHSGETTSVPLGSEGTLSLSAMHMTEDPPEAVRVRIANLYDNSLTLEFLAGDNDNAARYREVLARGYSPKQGSVSKTDVTPPSTMLHTSREQAAPQQRLPEQVSLAASAEYALLLDTFRTRSIDELELALMPFFKDLTGYLVELSSHTQSRDDWINPHYQAAVVVRQYGADISQVMLQKISDYYQDLTPNESEDNLWSRDIGSTDKLGLIDVQEYEDFLAIDRVVSLGEELNTIALEALTLRLATLVSEDPNRVRLPIHVRQLCRAFQQALTSESIPNEVLGDIFDYFSRHFVRQLERYYEPLNTYLAEHDIQPNIEIQIQNNGSMLTRNQESPRPERELRRTNSAAPGQESIAEATPAVTAAAANSATADNTGAALVRTTEVDRLHQQLGEHVTGALGTLNPAKLYSSVVDAMNFKREAEGLADGDTLASGTPLSGTWEGATVASADLDQNSLADAQSIVRALSRLQHNSQARDEVQQSDSLRAYLADNKEAMSDLQNTSGLSADSLNQLDMVDNLFGTIKSQLDVSAEMKPALGNLQIPLAKLALMDPRFFVDHTHTARAVVDKLSQLATSANFPNKALEGRITTIVDDIISDYESDSTVFDLALDKINRLVAQQERALSRNIDRVVRTQEGQEKLAEARRAVTKLIGSRLQPPAAPKVLIDLIEDGWKDLLVLTHVKAGPESAEWAEQVRTLDLIALWLDEQLKGNVDNDLSMQRSLEAEPLIDLIGQQISSALPTNMTHEAILNTLRETLAGTIDVETSELTGELATLPPGPEQVRAKIEDLPRLRRWVRRVEELEKDCWLTYRDKDGSKKRMQLAWISPMRDRYIFVNKRGQKMADLSAIKLARQLSRGAKPPAPTEQLSVVDQSMYHTLEHVQKTLSFARNHDSLTKLINRETFLNQLARALRHSQLKRSQHAVLYLNIDQFKLVNDVYDRISGDEVLLEFAKLLSQLHGKKSSSARIEADEFAILLLDRPADKAMEMAEKIRSDIAGSSMDIEGENVTFTVSIGVAPILEHSPSVEKLLEDAQSAMQHAKQQGRNKVFQFEDSYTNASEYKLEKKRSREELEKALATERFVLRAQPIVQAAVSDRAATSLHYELLLALVNKDGTLESPQDFIMSAERYGFMTLVDRWVIREAFSWISQLMDDQKVVPDLSINLSGSSVTDDGFMEYLFEQISEFGVGTSKLCFEITETGTISNLVKAADFVRAFRNIGCKFSIDDFGTGLASHNYLRELPVDYVKIDGSFVTGIHKNRTDYAMVRSINDLAHFLGQETIAESVENEDIVKKLDAIGVDYLQGWGIGHPKLLADITADLSNLEK